MARGVGVKISLDTAATESRAALTGRVRSAMEVGSLGYMLYGSQARATAAPHSDIDVLELVEKNPRAYSINEINVTQYTAAGLRLLAERGSLFVLHLRADGQVLDDPQGILRRCLAQYRPPRSYEDVWSEITIASGILLTEAADFDTYAHQLGRLGIYLLRSAVYLRALEREHVSFDLDELTAGDIELNECLERRRRTRLARDDVVAIRTQLARLVQVPVSRSSETVEAYAIGNASSPALNAMFTSVLTQGDGVDYIAMTLPPL